MRWRKIDDDNYAVAGWRVYRAKLPHDVYFLTKGDVRLKTSSKELMLEILKGGEHGKAESY